MKTKKWKTAPISPTCENWDENRQPCGRATSFAYPADGGGWMALCYRHGLKHLPQILTIETLIQRGEKFQ